MKSPSSNLSAREGLVVYPGAAFPLRTFLALVALLLLSSVMPAAAQTATTTTLPGLPPNSFQTLVATVKDSNNNPVTVGSVTFYSTINGDTGNPGVSVALGTLQVIRSNAKGFTPGTATLKTFLGPGRHDVRAVFNGTRNYASSSSLTSAIIASVNAAGESVLFSASGSPGNYTLTTGVTVTGSGIQGLGPATGTVNFFDNTLNTVIGGAQLGNLFTNPTGFLAPNGTFNFNHPYAQAVQAGDFNNDGNIDLAISTSDTNSTQTGYIQILLGNGNGTFTLKQTAQVISTPQKIKIWDFNGDGVLDMAVANTFPCGDGFHECGYISILTGNGDGSFTVNAQALSSGDSPRGLEVGDLSGDGIPDLIVANSGNHLNQCNATTTPVLTAQVYLDSTVGYYIANTNGSFQSQRTVLITYPTTDLSRCQFVGQGGLGGYINLANKNRSNPFEVAVGDFEGNGNLDVAVIDKGYQRVFLLHNDGNGNLNLLNPSVYFWNIGNYPTSVATGDVNHDGRTDLVIMNSLDSSIGVLVACGNPNNGSCGSPTPNLFPTSRYYYPGTYFTRYGSPTNSVNVALSDINGDGNLDIVVQNQNENSVSVIPGNGNGTFQDTLNYPAGSNPFGLATGDFNGDGLQDVAVSASQNNPVNASILLNSTGSLTTTASLFGVNIPVLGSINHSVRSGYGFADESGNTTGDNNYPLAYSNSLFLTGTPMPNTLSVSQNPASGVVGGRVAVTLSATIAPANVAGYVPSGTITFYDGGTNLGTGTVSGASASIAPRIFPTVGTHSILAVYSGDANFAGSSVYYNLVIDPYVPPTTSIALMPSPDGTGTCNPPNNIAPSCVFNGQTTVQLTGRVNTTPTALSGNTITGSVTFYDGNCVTGTKLGTGMLGTTTLAGSNASAAASISTIFATVATHSLCAQYSGDSNFAVGTGSQSLIVSQFITPTATTLNVSPNGASASPGTVLNLTATVRELLNNTNLNTGQITFYDGSRRIGTAQILNANNAAKGYVAGTAYLSLRLPLGVHSLTAAFTARATGPNHYGGSTSAARSITIRPASGVPTNVSLGASANSPYTLTANLSASGVTPFTGTLSFLDQTAGNFNLGSGAIGNSSVVLNFNVPVTTPVGVAPFATAADFNGDGLADVAIGSGTDHTVKINLGQANGTFTSPATLTVCTPSAIVVADFNNDGVPDLAVVGSGTTACTASQSNTRIALFTGNGNGTFTSGTTLTANTAIQPFAASLAVGDLNGDGASDLIIAKQMMPGFPIACPAFPNTTGAPGFVSVMLGNGNGTFGAEVNYDPESHNHSADPTEVAVVDYDGDGYQDVVMVDSEHGYLEALLGKGDGTLTARSTNNQLIDISSVSNNANASVNGGWGDGGICSTATIPGSPFSDLVVGDFDGDGLNDYAILDPGNLRVSVLLTTNNRTFGAISYYSAGFISPSGTPGANYQTQPWALAASDLNGDGIGDLVVTNVNANQCVLSTNPAVTCSRTGFNYFGDAANISLLVGTRSGGFLTPTILPGSFINVPPDTATPAGSGKHLANQYGYLSAITGDFNGDGFMDVGAINNIPAGTNQTTVLINGGLSNGTCCSATATASVSGGAISAINLISHGSGYGSAPNCTIFSPTGSGATCSCSVGLADPPSSYVPTATAYVGGGGTIPGLDVIFQGQHLYQYYYVQLSYWNQTGETRPTTQSDYLALSAPGYIVVTGPPPMPEALGYNIYLYDASNGGYKSKKTITGFGDATMTSLTFGGGPVFSNSTFDGTVHGCTVTNGGSNYSTGTLGPSWYVFNGNPIVSATAQASGIVTHGGGSHSVIGSYPGDANYGAANSPPITLGGTQLFVTAALGASLSANAPGATATLNASISPYSIYGLTAGGTFTFYEGGTQIGTAQALNNGAASIVTPPLSGGLHSFSANYSGDTNFLTASATTNATVAPIATTTTVSAPATSQAGQSITIQSTVSPSSVGAFIAGGIVTFMDGGTQIGSPQPLSAGHAQISVATLGAGSHTLKAVYSGDTNFGPSQSNSAASINISIATTSLSLVASPSAPLFGQPVTLTATLTPSTLNSLVAGGTVTFYDGAEVIESGLISNGGAEFVTSSLSASPHNLKASYSGDTNFAASDATLALAVVAPPTISKAFGAGSIPLGGSTSLTFTIGNINGATMLNGIGFSDTLPAGLTISTPNGLSNSPGGCTGTITATQGTNIISLSGASLNQSTQCTFAVNVTGTAAGEQNNTTGNVTSTEGGAGGVASASIKVMAPPTLAKAFNPAIISPNGTTSLSFTITNPTGNPDSLTGVGFTDTLPAGLTVANSNGPMCGGTLVTSNATSISLSGATVAVNTPCQFNVTVTGVTSGNYSNTVNGGGTITSSNGGTGVASNTANLTVASPPTIQKTFGAPAIQLNTTASLTFTIQNPNSTVSLSGIAFTDTLPPGLVVAPTSNLSNSCGGTATAVPGSSAVSLSGGTRVASATCTVQVDVQGKTAGAKDNTVQVTSTEAGNGNTSNASITVVAPPTISKAFGVGSIPLGGSTSLTFTIGNTNGATMLNGIGFSDTLPAGLTISTPNGLSNSPGGCTGTITATQGTNIISLSGASLNQSTQCTFAVNVTGTAAGEQNNTTGNVTSTEGGSGAVATASVKVVAPPTLAKGFNPATISPNGTTSLSFTITNPTGNPDSLTGVGFTDTLPAGLTVADSNGAMCGGTLVTSNATNISLSGATVAVNTPCQFNVTVTGVTSGNYSNTVNGGGTITSSNGGTGVASNTANLLVCSASSVVTNNDDSGSGSLRQAIIDSCVGANITFDMSRVTSPIVLTGGELLIDKSLTINGPTTSGLTINGNNSSRVFNVAAGNTVAISNLTIANGQANNGGGIYNLGNLTISNSTFTVNHAVGGSGGGGAIDSEGGTLTIINSTISGNAAETDGGGLLNGGNSTAVLTNVTITNNRADADGNTTGAGGGIGQVSSNAITLHNTIVAGNFNEDGATDSSDDFFVAPAGAIDPLSSHNLIGVDTAVTGISNGDANGNQIGTASTPKDPRLGALANNGGPTQTHALLAGSPALDGGDNAKTDAAGLTTDQRGTGFLRKRDAADADTTQTVDIGAFEADPSVEDIIDKSTPEDTLLSFSFSIGDGSPAFDSITATSGDQILVPDANITVGPETTSTRLLSITPAANLSGTATITVTVKKTVGGTLLSMTDTFVLTVAEVNDAPTANPDPLTSVAEDSGVRTIPIASLLANDIKGPVNESGQTLTLIGVGSAVGGAVQIVGTDVQFTPTADFNGPASFDYTITDDGTTGGAPNPKTATGTVSFTVTEVNDAPTAVNDSLSPIAEDSGVRTIPFSDLTGNDNQGAANESGQTLIVKTVSNPVGGTVQIVGTDVKFAPTADYNGAASFDYTTEDNGTTNGIANPLTSAAAATASFTITEVNDAPTAVADSLSSIAEDSGVRTIPFSDLTGNDNQGAANESGQTLIVKTVTNPLGGTVQIVGTDVKFTPTADYNGPASFDYTVEDNGTTNGAANPLTSPAATVSFTITEVNDAPTANHDTLADIAEDSGPRTIPFTDLTGNDSKGPANESGQALIVKTVSNPLGGAVQIVGTDVLFTPTANYNGPAGFQYTVEDNGTTNGVANPLTSAAATVSFNASAVADTPQVPASVTTLINTQTSDVAINRNAADGSEVTNFKITNIQNGTLYRHDGVTPIADGQFILVAQGQAGLRFTPNHNLNSPSSTFGFDVQASTDNLGGGISGIAHMGVTVSCDAALVVKNTLNSGTDSLRDVIARACPGATISFDPTAFAPTGSPFTITLSTELAIDKDLTITGPAASRVIISGGGVSRVLDITSGNVNISNLTISAGTISGGNGGGLLNTSAGTLTLANMAFTGSTADNGGAISTSAGTIKIYNGTISGNTATGDGGGLYHNIGGTVDVLNSTVTNNNAGQGGGIRSTGGTTNLKNSIVAGNTASANVNVIGTTDQGNNVLTGNPKLAPLANNGGPTQTHALLAGSPALDAGDNTAANNAGLSTDQRGGIFGRIRDAASDADTTATVDIGAFEADPSVEDITDKATTEDTALPSFSFNAGDSSTIAFDSITATSSNTTLVPDANIIITGSGSTRSLSITPAADQNGTATITVTVTKTISGTVLSMTDTFLLTVTEVNDPPVANDDSLSSVAEDSGQRTISIASLLANDSVGANESGQTLTLTAVGSAVGGTVSKDATNVYFTPAANFNGPASFQYTASDNGMTNGGPDPKSGTATVSFNVTAINDAPTLDVISNLTINEDATLQTVNLSGITAGPANEGSQTLTIMATSSNPGVIPNPTVNYTSANATGTLTFTPVANAHGSATITVTVNDGGGTANGGVDTVTRAFTVTVNSVNDMPSFTKGADQTTFDPNPQTVPNWATNISAGPPDESGQALTFQVSNNNSALFAVQPAISPSGTLTYRADYGADGVATVSVKIKDDGGTANGGVDTSAPQTFVLTIHALNNAPTLNAIGNRTIDEDAALQTVNLSGITPGPSYESTQTLTVTATSSNTGLIPNPSVSYTSPNPTGSISFTPVPNANGSVAITVTVKDSGGTLGSGVDTFSRTFIVTVNAINDAPVNSVPGSQNGTLNGTLVFSSANGNLISISDVDAGSDPVQVNLKATDGTLSLSTISGLTFTAGDGTDDPLMTFTGSIPSINAALNGMSNLAFGTGVIEITTNDLGHNGAGGALSDTDTVSVTVIDNLAPALLTVEGSDRAITLDSVTLLHDPFPLMGTYNFSADHRTRIALFALHTQLRPGEDASAVTAEADDGGTIIPLTVESVRTVPNFDWLTQVVVRFPDLFSTGGGGPQDVKVRIRLRGANSNQAMITIMPVPPGH